jgi:hypothetical protein
MYISDLVHNNLSPVARSHTCSHLLQLSTMVLHLCYDRCCITSQVLHYFACHVILMSNLFLQYLNNISIIGTSIISSELGALHTLSLQVAGALALHQRQQIPKVHNTIPHFMHHLSCATAERRLLFELPVSQVLMVIPSMVVPLAGRSAIIFPGVSCMQEHSKQPEEPRRQPFLTGKGNERRTVAHAIVANDINKVEAAPSGQ